MSEEFPHPSSSGIFIANSLESTATKIIPKNAKITAETFIMISLR